MTRMLRARDLSVGAFLQTLSERLREKSETPALDAQTLLGHILQRPRAWLLAHPEARLEAEQVAALETAVQRVENGEPLPYVLGKWEFFGLTFEVTPDVLIPRPESELLIERALSWLRAHPERLRIADVGAGSGCLGLALAVHFPRLRVFATDLSFAALRVARRNATRHGVADRVQTVCSDLLTACHTTFDLILANLPYIPTEALRQLAVYGKEPTLALDGGPDGLLLIRRLLEQAPHSLAPGGLLLLEIETSQGVAARSLAANAFANAEIALHADLAGHDRVLEVRSPLNGQAESVRQRANGWQKATQSATPILSALPGNGMHVGLDGQNVTSDQFAYPKTADTTPGRARKQDRPG